MSLTALAALLLLSPRLSALSPDPVGTWPLAPEPAVVHGFDPPDSAYGAGHRGIDLAGRPGQPVLAALPGTVSFASMLAGRGVVVVSHGTTRTTYEPVTASVAMGEEVRAGQQLGTLAAVPSHCLPAACLHWGWLEDETYLDPLRLVGGGPVRLLPLFGDLPSSAPAGALAASPLANPLAGWRAPQPAYAAMVRPLPPLS